MITTYNCRLLEMSVCGYFMNLSPSDTIYEIVFYGNKSPRSDGAHAGAKRRSTNSPDLYAICMFHMIQDRIFELNDFFFMGRKPNSMFTHAGLISKLELSF